MSLSRTIAHVVAKNNLQGEDVIVILEKYKLLSLLPSIVQILKKIEQGNKAKDTIVIETPFPLDAKALESVQKITGTSSSPHEEVINKNLLAGFKAKWRGRLYDASAERMIKQLLTNHIN